MNIDLNDIEIKIKLLKSEATLAQVTVVLFGEWVEKGWRISKSKIEHPTFHEYLWIQAPSYSTGYGKWQDIVFIENKRLYEEVQYCRHVRHAGTKVFESRESHCSPSYAV